MNKLAIIITHPIQYYAPMFQKLTARKKIELKVFYTWPQAIEGFQDPDFGKEIKWDIPLLEDYHWEAVKNVSKKPSSKHWRGIICPDLNRRLEVYDPDAILVYGWKLYSHFRAMRYFKGKKPVWFFGDSTLLDERPGIRKVARRLWLKFVYRYVDTAFYVGINNKRYFQAHRLKENQLVLLSHVIDNERFEDNEERQYEEKASKWRLDIGYSADDIVVLFAGKFVSKKNPQILIDSIKKLHNSTMPQLHLLMVGNGPLETKLKQMAKDDPFIQFLPFQNQSKMPIIYRLANVFCLPSTGPGESWGLAVNESMVCGRTPIVSDKVGSFSDLIRNGITGYVFKTGDVQNLSDKIELATQNNSFLDMGINAKKLIKNWNYNIVCDALEQTLLHNK